VDRQKTLCGSFSSPLPKRNFSGEGLEKLVGCAESQRLRYCTRSTNARHAVGVAESEAAPHGRMGLESRSPPVSVMRGSARCFLVLAACADARFPYTLHKQRQCPCCVPNICNHLLAHSLFLLSSSNNNKSIAPSYRYRLGTRHQDAPTSPPPLLGCTFRHSSFQRRGSRVSNRAPPPVSQTISV